MTMIRLAESTKRKEIKKWILDSKTFFPRVTAEKEIGILGQPWHLLE